MSAGRTEVARLARRHSVRRTALRRKLEKRAVPPEEIERMVERLRVDQQTHRDIVAAQETIARVDDSGYQPKHVDGLLKGPARATGQTATAVKRGRTVTLNDYRVEETQP